MCKIIHKKFNNIHNKLKKDNKILLMNSLNNSNKSLLTNKKG